jgi:hypothetical protein
MLELGLKPRPFISNIIIAPYHPQGSKAFKRPIKAKGKAKTS